MNKTLSLCLAGIVIGLSGGLLLPVVQDALTAKPADELLPQPTIELPEQGVQTDAFSLRLFHAALQQQKDDGTVTVAPFSAKILLGSMAETFRFTGEAEQEIAATQQGIDDRDSAAPVDIGIYFMADYDLPRKADAPQMQVLPFRSDYPTALSAFNGNIADFFELSYVNIHPFVSRDTRLLAQVLTRYTPPWLRSFHEVDTKKDAFDNGDGAMPQISMMRCFAPFRVAESADGKWKAIALFFAPQQGKGQTPVAFIGILPQGDAREFAEHLTPQLLSEIRTALVKAPYAPYRVELPRLTVAPTPRDLTPVLQAVGMQAPFDARKAPFTTLTQEKIAMNSAVQCMHLELKEASGRTAKDPLLETDTAVFRFDRPFLWVISDLTSATAPYFIGLVENL